MGSIKFKSIVLFLALVAVPLKARAQPFSLLTSAPGPLVDPNAWKVSHTQWSANFSLLPSGGDEFGLNVQTRIAGPTRIPIATERASILGEISTSDPSTGTSTHDAVGITGMGLINRNNPSGRAFGLYGVAGLQPGGDGLLVGIESDVVNEGSDQLVNATPTTKVGLFISGVGPTPITTGIDLESAHAHTGIFAPPDVTVPPNAQLIDSGIKVRWADGATVVNNADGGYKENSINVAGGYYINGVRADLPVYDANGQPWAPDGAFIIVEGSQAYLCNDTDCVLL